MKLPNSDTFFFYWIASLCVLIIIIAPDTLKIVNTIVVFLQSRKAAIVFSISVILIYGLVVRIRQERRR